MTVKRLKRPRDPLQLGKLIVDIATAQVEDREDDRKVALNFMYYNFVRIHQTLRVTPAMAAGVTDRLWELSDIVALINEAAPKPGKRGPYKKRSLGTASAA